MVMMSVYGQLITNLPFPARKIFGSKSSSVSGERQKQLMAYLNVLLLTLVKVDSCPMFNNPTKAGVQKLSAFFHEDVKEAMEAVAHDLNTTES